MIKQILLLHSLVASLTLTSLPALIHSESPIEGYVIQYDVTIVSSKVWMSWDGKGHTCIFILSDGTRWITTSEKTFLAVTNPQWRAGDHLTIQLAASDWIATNTERHLSVPLYQLCNKGAENP